MTAVESANIKGYECKHATYRAGYNSDVVGVKRNIHHADGTITPEYVLVKDYKQKFWITKPGFQNHKDKKEWEKIERLQEFSSTRLRLTDSIAKAMGKPGWKTSLRMLARSPYLYGCDITTPVLIKNEYMTRYPNCVSPSSVAVLDIETDVVKGTEEIICASITYKDKAYLVATEEFMKHVPSPNNQLQKALHEHLGAMEGLNDEGEVEVFNLVERRNLTLEFEIVATPGMVANAMIQKAHKWKPDFVAIWNINFDLPKINAALEAEGYDIGDVYSDPVVPREFRTAKYIEGASQKVTATGKISSPHFADRWHTMDCLASFYLIDAMCVYKKIRTAQGNEASYSLDYILNKNLGMRKLKFDGILEQSHPNVRGGTLKWHQIMQQYYKIEYLIYNVFDCISVEMLDEKTSDLSKAISTLCSHSEYARFPSQPRRTVDDLHFVCLQKGLVIATTSDQMVEELDKYVVGMEQWI